MDDLAAPVVRNALPHVRARAGCARRVTPATTKRRPPLCQARIGVVCRPFSSSISQNERSVHLLDEQ
jgi:hypothetical protein